jgi:hypothetical protein
MPERVHGGVFTDEVVTGLLRHFVITGADFSGAQDANGKPIYGSAASIVFQEITQKATVVIMNPISQVNRGMSFALESNRADWTADELQVMINGLGNNVGSDSLDLTTVKVEEVPYDFTVGASMKFTDLLDTPNNYPNGFAGKGLAVTATEDGLKFVSLFSDYTVLNAPSALSVDDNYFINANMTLVLPSTVGLSIGNSIKFAKDVTVTAFLQTASPSELIITDIGSDTILNYDITEELLMVFDGNGWSVQVGSTL